MLNVAILAVALAHPRGAAFLKLAADPPSSAPPAVAPGPAAPGAVSTTVHAVMGLTAQYFVVHLVLAALRTYRGGAPLSAQRRACGLLTAPPAPGQLLLKVVAAAHDGPLKLCPMLCVLFLGLRLRALQLRKDTDALPQPWVQTCMQVLVWSVLAETLLALAAPYEADGTPSLADSTTAQVLVGLRTCGMLVTYGAFAAVVAGALLMAPPPGVWPDGPPPVSTALLATICLGLLFVSAHVHATLLRTIASYRGDKPRSALATSLEAAAQACPALGVLFVGARLRALDLDPLAGALPGYAQGGCAAGVLAVAAELGLLALAPEAPGRSLAGQLRGAAVVVQLAGASLVLAATLASTGALGPAMACVLNLTAQYLLVYLLHAAVKAVHEIRGSAAPEQPFALLAGTDKTVKVCPMLCCVFLALGLRARQLGVAVPAWATDAMHAATYAQLLQLGWTVICAGAFAFLVGSKCEVDEDGYPAGPGAKVEAAWLPPLLASVRAALLLAVYGGACACACACYALAPAAARP